MKISKIRVKSSLATAATPAVSAVKDSDHFHDARAADRTRISATKFKIKFRTLIILIYDVIDFTLD